MTFVRRLFIANILVVSSCSCIHVFRSYFSDDYAQHIRQKMSFVIHQSWHASWMLAVDSGYVDMNANCELCAHYNGAPESRDKVMGEITHG